MEAMQEQHTSIINLTSKQNKAPAGEERNKWEGTGTQLVLAGREHLGGGDDPLTLSLMPQVIS